MKDPASHSFRERLFVFVLAGDFLHPLLQLHFDFFCDATNLKKTDNIEQIMDGAAKSFQPDFLVVYIDCKVVSHNTQINKGVSRLLDCQRVISKYFLVKATSFSG